MARALLFPGAMELLIERNGGFDPLPLADGEHLLGSAYGVPPELALCLFVEGGRLSIEAAAPVRVGGVLLPGRLRRLVMPGEPIEPVPGCVFRVRPEPPTSAPATRAVVRTLLEPGAAPAAASLVSLTGMDAGRVLPLADRPSLLGRGEGADFRLRDRAISRLHARISPLAEGHAIEDLGTANGVYVNGARVHGPHLLEDGALVELGQTLLRYSAGRPPHRASQAASPTPVPLPARPDGGAPSGVPEAEVMPLAASDEAARAAGAESAEQSEARLRREHWLLASGALIFVLGIGLTVGCLAYAQSGQARSGLSPARLTTSSANRR